jgi:hypothetical protein
VFKDLASSWFTPAPEAAKKYLQRMQLDKPYNMREKVMRKVVVNALKMVEAI